MKLCINLSDITFSETCLKKRIIQGQTTHTCHTRNHHILKHTRTVYNQTKAMLQTLPQFHMGILFTLPQSQQDIPFIPHKNIQFMMLRRRISGEITKSRINAGMTMKKVRAKRKCQRSKRNAQNWRRGMRAQDQVCIDADVGNGRGSEI